MTKRRFPGILPFQTEEKDRFFGRDEDIRDLYALMLLEKMVVLFGKSGHGKSSLLNAGIVPLFLQESPLSERRYEPVIIKFGAWQDDKQAPVEIAGQLIFNGLGERINAPSLITNNALWYIARRSGFPRILLVFDQFEEFFTYPLPQQQRFAAELGELMHTDLPMALADIYANLPENEQDLLAEKMDIKAVFATREDRLHLLDKLKYPLPAIFARRYPLLPLTRKRAAEAISKPATLKGDFATSAFGFSPNTLNIILDYLDDKEGRVETNQLQIIAESFENRAALENVQIFTEQNLGDLKGIVARYYQDRIESLQSVADQLAVRKLCEEGLVQEGDPPIRLNLHEAQIRNFYGINADLLESLVQNRLLRAEPSGGGTGYTYELPHDSLLEPILEAKKERLENELIEAANYRASEAEAVAVMEKQRAEAAEFLKKEAQLGRKRARLFALLSTGTAVVAIILFGWALRERSDSQKSLDAFIEADQRRETAEKLNESIRAQMKELNQSMQISNLKKKIKAFINADAYGLARDSIIVLKALSPTDPEIKVFEKQIK